ncbi:MAG TPA: Asp23/Gls24 family envelope stress response protein [Gaiellales bacterium]|jgi:uncharacterized alkaline shock family protein YloU
MTDPTVGGAAESVHSAGVSAHISHAVIAAYAAAAAREVAGVHALTGGHLARLERRGDPDRLGVRVASAGDAVDLELHLVTDWGASIPAVADGVERSVRTYLASMVDLDVRTVSVVVDDVAAAR